MIRNTNKLRNEHDEYAWRHNARTSQLISMGKDDKLYRKCMNDTEASETWRDYKRKRAVWRQDEITIVNTVYRYRYIRRISIS